MTISGWPPRSGFRFFSRLVRMTSTPVVGQDEAADAGLRRDFGRNGARTGGQDRRHEARTVGLDQLYFPDRLARDEGSTHDRAGDLGRCVGPLVAANECAAGRGGRPSLPLHVFGDQGLAKADVGFGDEYIHGLQLRHRRGRGRLVVGTTRKISGNAASAESDDQDDNTCGIHTLTICFYTGVPGRQPLLRAGLSGKGISELASAKSLRNGIGELSAW